MCIILCCINSSIKYYGLFNRRYNGLWYQSVQFPSGKCICLSTLWQRLTVLVIPKSPSLTILLTDFDSVSSASTCTGQWAQIMLGNGCMGRAWWQPVRSMKYGVILHRKPPSTFHSVILTFQLNSEKPLESTWSGRWLCLATQASILMKGEGWREQS